MRTRSRLDLRPTPSRQSLAGARLSGADLRGAWLTGRSLANADLRGACLRGGDLTRADLRGADLTRADLRGAMLREADLRGANLTGAQFADTDLRGALYDAATRWSRDVSPQVLTGVGPMTVSHEWRTLQGSAGLYSAVTVAVLAADQLSKGAAQSALAGKSAPVLGDILTLGLVRNSGAALGILSQTGGWLTLIGTVLVVALAGIAAPRVWGSSKVGDGRMGLALALALGGGLGNLIDRLTAGAVIDFLRLRGFFVFNLADVAIACGLCLLLGALDSAERSLARRSRRLRAELLTGDPEPSVRRPSPMLPTTSGSL